jgi:hypothetical protein
MSFTTKLYQQEACRLLLPQVHRSGQNSSKGQEERETREEKGKGGGGFSAKNRRRGFTASFTG